MSKSKHEPSYPLTMEALRANAARIQADTDRIVRDFLKRWGGDFCAEDLARIRDNPGKPLVLVVDFLKYKRDLITHVLEDRMGLLVCTAHNGRVMLAKIKVLQPHLIVTGLNTLHFYQPSYNWAVVNAERADGIPMVFATAASEFRQPLEVPKGPGVRILPLPFYFSDCIAVVKRMLRPRPQA